YILWTASEGGRSLLWWSRRQGGSWTTPEALTTGTDADIAVDSEGRALLAWFDRPALMVSRYEPDARTWSAALAVGTWTQFAEVRVAGVALEGAEAATAWAQVYLDVGYETRSVRYVDGAWVTQLLGLGAGPVAIHRSMTTVGTFTFNALRMPGPTARF